MKNLLTATEIDSWSRMNPRRAQEVLPELIVNLILCTSSKINDYNFPIEKGIQYAGYDGVLNAGESSSYFPVGKSVWEFGTNENALEKFRSDIQKRSDNPLGVDINNTVFIFVTLKIWNHRNSIEEIVNESKDRYNWKDIRIIDGCKIALWLQTCEAVAVWLATIMGKNIDGVRTIEDFWKDYCESTSPKLNKEFFLIGRELQIEQLSKWIQKESGSLTVISESLLESALFVAAYFFERDQRLLKKTLIIESPDVWNGLVAKNETDCILIPTFNFTEDIRCPTEMLIILPVAQYSPLSKITRNIESIKIGKRSKSLFYEVLESLGYETADFSKIEAETKRSFLPLYRNITTVVTRKQPRWLSATNIQDLIPAFLLGGWDGNKEGDKEAIEKISGLCYADYIQKIDAWLTAEDAPIFKVFNTYQIVSSQDMWTFLYESLTDIQLERFRACIISVFGTEDPTFELPEEHWAMASIYGKETKYSMLLREGLIISLILLSEQGERDNNCNIISAENYVDSIVREILEPIQSWRQWNTIAPSLTLLSEASPKSFLEKMEREIANERSEIWHLFKPIDDVLFGRNYYTHILWAIEQLVWYESYAIRAINLLFAINEKQFKYTLVNSPINTLYEIFCVWYPQSCLSHEQRIEVVKRTCKVYPKTGKELIDRLLPTGHSTCGNIQKPRWHSIEKEFKEGVTNEEYVSMVRAIANIAFNFATTTNDWKTIVDKAALFFSIDESWPEKMLETCEKLSENKKLEVADLLCSAISRNREFCNANWAIPEKYILRMEEVLTKIAPIGIEKYTYLFKSCPSLLHPIPYDKDFFDYKKRRDNIISARINAANEILTRYGSDSLIDFSLHVEATEELAKVIAQNVFNNIYNFSLLDKIKLRNRKLYASILYELYRANGLDNLFDAVKNSSISNEEKADILSQGPLDIKIWDKLGELDKEIVKHYWQHVEAFRLYGEEEKYTDFLLGQLLKYDRPFSAARIIVFSEYANSEMIMEVLCKCCELQEHTEPTGASLKSLAGHDILDLFNKLYRDCNVDLDRLVQLEVSFLPCFKYASEPKGILKYFQERPIEYVDLITYNYKPDQDSALHQKNCSSEQRRLAYEIVELFTTVPGCNKDLISEKKFKDWIASAQDYANQIGYRRSFDYCLGRLFSYAPIGSDGIFPHEFVRNYFECFQTEKLLCGFLIGKQNQRGVHPVTGGMAEKEIANKYREDASSIRIAYPHTAAVLEKLADSYWQESLYEQKRELLDFRG